MSAFLKTGFGKVVLAAGVLIIIIAAVLIFQSTEDSDELSDINGAINIMKKVVPKDLLSHIQWDSGDIISPKRVKLVNFIT